MSGGDRETGEALMSHNPEGISMDLHGNLDYDDEPDTCEFAAYDQEGNLIGECRSIDYEVVEMYDGDTVRICAKHRSWLPAMGRALGTEKVTNE